MKDETQDSDPSGAALGVPPGPQETTYYIQAIALVADELCSMSVERFEDKRDKLVAILRNAVHHFGAVALHPVPLGPQESSNWKSFKW